MITKSLLLTLILTAAAKADTYTWSGSDGNFSNPASWSGPAPILGGSPTDQLLFTFSTDPTSPVTPIVDSPWTLNALYLGLPSYITNPGFYVILNATNSGALNFQGPNATLFSNNFGPSTINVPISTTSNLTFSGNSSLTLTAPLSSTNPNAQLLITSTNGLNYQNNTAPTGFASTLINAPLQFGPALQWSYTLPNSTPVTLSFGQGPIILDAGGFSLNLITPTTTSSATATLTNPIIVRANGGVLNTETLTAIPLENITFSGPILLGGILYITNDRNTNNSSNALSTTITVSNTITLDQSTPADLHLGNDGRPINQTTLITGNIIDDPNPTHTQQKTLHLYGVDSTGTFTIAGTNNTYSTGTSIDWQTVTVAPNSRLGTGNVTVNNGILRLTSLSNLAPGSTVLLADDNFSTLSITFDASPAAILDPTTTGILALDTDFSTPLDMSTLGSGLMELGSANNSSYTAPTLAPGIDNTYRFASYTNSGLLTLTHSVLTDHNNLRAHANLANVILAAPNSYSGGSTITANVYANVPNSLGTGNISIGPNPFGDPSSTTLFLNAPNTYNSTAQVDVYATLAAIGPTGSIPLSTTPPILHPGSALILGDNLTNNSDRYPDAMPLNLNASTLILKGFAATTETVGPISITGVSTIVLENPGSPTLPNPNSTTLLSPSLSHAPHAVLFYVTYHEDPTYPSPNLQPSDSPDGDTLRFTAAPLTTNNMLPPWIQSRATFYHNEVSLDAPSFLNYSPTAGLIPAAYTPLPTTGGTSTEIVDIPNSPTTLQTDTSIYALRLTYSLLNPVTSTPTLHITSGGLIATAPSPFRTDTLIIQPNINFASAEAFINVDTLLTTTTSDLQLTGTLTANNGLTKFGFGTLTLSNPNNQITGPITILEGTLELAALPEPHSTDPIILTNSGSLNFLSDTTLTRPVTINNQISFFFAGATISSNQSLTIAAPITTSNSLRLSAGTTLNIQTPLNTPNGLYLTAPEIHLSANISAPGIALETHPGGRLTGAALISSSIPLYFDLGTISPGDHPGDLASFTFNTPDFQLANQSSLEFDLTPTGLSDHLLFTGSLTLVSYDPEDISIFGELPPSLNLHFLSPPTGQIYTLLTYSSLTGTFSAVTGLPANYTLDYTPTALLLTPTPEPTSLTLLLPLLPLLLCKTPKKRKNATFYPPLN